MGENTNGVEESRLLMDESAMSHLHDCSDNPDVRKVFVCVKILKVGDINTIKESFAADVIVQSRWREPTLDGRATEVSLTTQDWEKMWNPKICIENELGKPTKSEKKLKLVYPDGGAEAFVREKFHVKGRFFEALELWEFPFDIQDVTVHMVSELASAEVKLIDDPDDMHDIFKQSFCDAQEWRLYKYVEPGRARDHFDTFDTRSTISVRCKAARNSGFFLWNIFSVSLLICCLAFATFAIKPELPHIRMQLAFVLVLTAVASKTAVISYLPRISYLTILDKHILATIVMATVTCFWHAIQAKLPHEFHEYDWVAPLVLAGVYGIYLIIFIRRVIIGPYKLRREMARNEVAYTAELQSRSQKAIQAKTKAYC